jgi:acyl dehydratase
MLLSLDVASILPGRASMIWWEDFKVGERAEMGRHTFTEDEILEFGRAFDPQPFHADPQAAKQSFFGGLIASGWHTCSVAMRIMVESYLEQAASLGAPGVDSIRWPKPVRPGDTLVFRREVLAARASTTRPGVGLVKHRWEATNQRGELVMTMEGWGMFGRRP